MNSTRADIIAATALTALALGVLLWLPEANAAPEYDGGGGLRFEFGPSLDMPEL